MQSSDTYTMPTHRHGPSSPVSHSKPWQSRVPSFRAGIPESESEEQLSRENTRGTTQSRSSTKTARWWRIQLFRGMINDVKRRAPYYWSDWKDAWDYRVVPATVYMYFAKYAGLQSSMPLHSMDYCNLIKSSSRIQHTPSL
ncbi:hypothetical protein BJ546DRAFT_451213 [Cryomyces antarcticus]